MKFPLSWLQEYIDIKLSPEELAKTLTAAGLEVDAITADTASGDTIFEVSLTPNLGHCASLIGIARELAAATYEPLRLPPHIEEFDNSSTLAPISVTIADPALCPRYGCRVVTDIEVAPSPAWMQKRLLACGIRPINNVVDITNYVLLETGQPLHAFDLEKLPRHSIVVRKALPGEEFTTLDNVVRPLTAEDLVICSGDSNNSTPIALAGIMGGANSEIDNSTTQLLIESAHFQPAAIRRTSKRLGLHTDAARRFERFCDPSSVLFALNRAASLLHDIAEGRVASCATDVAARVLLPALIYCRLSKINQLLGTHLSYSEVADIFGRLDFKYEWNGKDLFSLTIPTYRHDILAEVDLIEEVARTYGYDNISPSTPKYTSSNLPHTPIYLFEKSVRSALLAEGLQELLTCDLLGPTLLEKIGESSMPSEAEVRVLNPASIEQSILRTSLLPGLLQVVQHNAAHQNSNIGGFEVGRIHFKDGEQFKEQVMVGIIMTGKRSPHHWDSKDADYDFFDLKGAIEALTKRLGVDQVQFRNSDLKSFHPGRQASIFAGELEVGTLGEVHPSIVKRLDLSHRIFFAEISLHDLYKVHTVESQAQELPTLPASSRDWTVPLQSDFPVQTVLDQIWAVATPLLESVTLTDLYLCKSADNPTRNATFHFVYRDREKTISQAAADAEHAHILNEVTKFISP